jgi:hypothetical protein
VEELLFARGIIVTYEAIRKWCYKFGQQYANQLRRRRPRPGDKWHLDEVFLDINRERHYLWRAVDQDGNMLNILDSGTTMARSDRRQEILPKGPQGLAVCPMRDHHRSIEELWGGETGKSPECGTSPAPLSQQSCEKLALAEPPARAADAGV